MSDQHVVDIVSALGGLDNVVSATNCMTRLRVTVADESAVNEGAIKQNLAVLGLVHDHEAYYEIVVGPGKAKTYANAVNDMMKKAGSAGAAAAAAQSPNEGNAAVSSQKPSFRAQLKHFCKILGGIFVPLIPGFIVSGICGSFAMIIQQLVPGYSDSVFWGCL